MKKDTKTDSKTNDQELDPFVGIVLGGLAIWLGGKVISRICTKNEEDEKPSNQYNTELEALRRLFREGLL